jgi:hypothetical protein
LKVVVLMLMKKVDAYPGPAGTSWKP